MSLIWEGTEDPYQSINRTLRYTDRANVTIRRFRRACWWLSIWAVAMTFTTVYFMISK